MKSATAEYQKGKWLVVDYPSCDDKPEYRKPILCRAKDIGKIVYGMWIIGDKQYSKFQDDSRSDDEEKFFTAYKLVKEMFIRSNFELDKSDAPFIIKIGNPSAGTITEPAWEYFVAPFIDDYRPCYNPEIDGTEDGLIYIKMPSGAEEKQTNNAAEEKFADRPHILKGDIIRVEISDNCTPCCIAWAVQGDYVYGDSGAHFFPIDSVVAIYRFDGYNFKCIWESETYKLRKWKESLANAAESARRAGVSLKEVTAAFERLIKEKSGETRKEKSND